jgi:hypothetical protein
LFAILGRSVRPTGPEAAIDVIRLAAATEALETINAAKAFKPAARDELDPLKQLKAEVARKPGPVPTPTAGDVVVAAGRLKELAALTVDQQAAVDVLKVIEALGVLADATGKSGPDMAKAEELLGRLKEPVLTKEELLALRTDLAVRFYNTGHHAAARAVLPNTSDREDRVKALGAFRDLVKSPRAGLPPLGAKATARLAARLAAGDEPQRVKYEQRQLETWTRAYRQYRPVLARPTQPQPGTKTGGSGSGSGDSADEKYIREVEKQLGAKLDALERALARDFRLKGLTAAEAAKVIRLARLTAELRKKAEPKEAESGKP